MAKDEPQSYGSQSDWVTGKTGQKVNDPKSTPSPKHQVFYENLREEETRTEDQGGKISPVQLAENDRAPQPGGESGTPTQKVPDEKGGARRDSYFKKRDYE